VKSNATDVTGTLFEEDRLDAAFVSLEIERLRRSQRSDENQQPCLKHGFSIVAALPHTCGCYRRDAARLLAHVAKPLSRLTLGDLQSFAQSLIRAGLAPISRARTLAAVKSLFGFCQPSQPSHPICPCYSYSAVVRRAGI
jgi:site-specific recombinase XerD